VQDATSVMKDQIGGIERSFYAEGRRGLTSVLDFYLDRMHIVILLLLCEDDLS